MPIENVDTDQIIPSRFLKATSRKGFGDNLFRDWRYDKKNNPIEGFVLSVVISLVVFGIFVKLITSAFNNEKIMFNS